MIESLVEYAQRSDLIAAEKGTMQLIYNNRKAELVLLGKDNFIIENGEIRRITLDKLVKVKKEEFEKAGTFDSKNSTKSRKAYISQFLYRDLSVSFCLTNSEKLC